MSDVQSFWKTFCSASGVAPETPFQTWFFGSNSEQARELAELVINGPKRATASLVAFNEIHPDVAPIADGYSVVTDFEGNPICVIRTTEIRHLPFEEVDAEFAFDEGEGDRTLEDWREGHRNYFSREALENDLEFSDSALICCERFELVFRELK